MFCANACKKLGVTSVGDPPHAVELVVKKIIRGMGLRPVLMSPCRPARCQGCACGECIDCSTEFGCDIGWRDGHKKFCCQYGRCDIQQARVPRRRARGASPRRIALPEVQGVSRQCPVCRVPRGSDCTVACPRRCSAAVATVDIGAAVERSSGRWSGHSNCSRLARAGRRLTSRSCACTGPEATMDRIQHSHRCCDTG